MQKFEKLIEKMRHKTEYKLNIDEIMTLKEFHIKHKALRLMKDNLKLAIEKDMRYSVLAGEIGEFLKNC